MHLPEIDKYAHLDSLIQRWDPRVKILTLSFLIVILSCLPDISSALMGLVIAGILFIFSKIPFAFLVKQLRWVSFFILFFLVVLPLTVPGKILLKVRFLTISEEGLELASLITLRALSIFILLVVILGTSKFHITLKALQSLRVPNRLIQMVMFSYRYIFLFWEELRRAFISAWARLFKRRTDIYTLRITANLVGSLFIRGLERTQRVYQAMICRGYRGKIKSLERSELKKSDFLKAVLVSLGGLLLITMGWFL